MASSRRRERAVTYWRIASRTTSCIDRCSRSATARNASVSSSLSRRVIATTLMIPRGITLAQILGEHA